MTQPASSSPRPPYFILTLLFLFLSLTGLGLIGVFVPNSNLFFMSQPVPTPTLVPSLAPTVIPTSAPSPYIEPVASDSGSVVTLTASPSASASPALKPTLVPSLITPSLSPVPTPKTITYKSSTQNFSLNYSSSRKLYEDKEKGTISRYTFYRSDSSFALHIGPDWSWSHPARVFDQPKVSGISTFRYESSGQLLVDLESGTQKITLQCIHNNVEAVKSECQEFISSFKLN
ncbi:MAG: hypothetical protein WCT01_02530 [Candidatus Shapirobacteria bacterium]